MSKKQTEEKTSLEAEQSTSGDLPKKEPPHKQGIPGQQNRMMKASQMVQKMAMGETGASGRAQASGEMQAALGNARTGQMMAAPPKQGAPTEQSASEEHKKLVELPGDKDKPKTPAKPAPLPPITTPLPQGAVRNKSGAAEVAQGGVKITLLPDKQSSKKLVVDGVERDAVTRPELTWGTPKNYGIEDGKITSVDLAPPVMMTIQTVYGPGAKAGDKSAYGRGTTAEDIKAGKTTLGHHEGSHGQDALQYIKDHPLPQFAGKSGMTVDEYKQAEKDYHDAMRKYNDAMAETSKKQTDCVGTPDEGCEE